MEANLLFIFFHILIDRSVVRREIFRCSNAFNEIRKIMVVHQSIGIVVEKSVIFE